MALPFMKQGDPAEKAAALAEKLAAKDAKRQAKLEAKAQKPANKAAAYAAKVARKAERQKAKLEAKAQIRAAKFGYKASREDQGFWRGMFTRCREVLATISVVIDDLSTATFISVADRAMGIAVLAVIFVCYGLDLFFFGSKAPEWFLVPLFLLIGFGLRTIAVAAGVKLESLKGQKDEQRARWMWRAIFAGCVIACMISAVSFFVGGYQRKESVDSSITTVASASTASVDAQIAALRQQQADIRADRDKNIATLQGSIDGIVHDKSDKNDGEADPYRADQAKERESARLSLAAIDTQITNLIATKGQTVTNAAQKSSDVAVSQATTWAAFSWFSGRTGADERDVVDVGMLFFAILIEIIAAFGPGAYFSIRKKFRAAVRRLKATEAEEEAELDAEIAQIEKRTALARAAAAAARTADVEDDDAVVKKAQELVEDAKRAKAIAEAEAEAARIRAETEAIRNAANAPPLTKKQQDAQNAGLAAGLSTKTRGMDEKIPAGDWLDRADRVLTLKDVA